MEFYIGGFAQGKLERVLGLHEGEELAVWDGAEERELPGRSEGKIVLNRFHLWVRGMLERGENPEQELERFLERIPDCIVISDEVGNGIVPMERSEREYRERLGRMQTALAAKSERVERVICGLGQRLK